MYRVQDAAETFRRGGMGDALHSESRALDELRAQRRRAAHNLDEVALRPSTAGPTPARVTAALERAEAELELLERPDIKFPLEAVPILLSPIRQHRAIAAADASARFRLSLETERRCAAAAKARSFLQVFCVFQS